VKQLIPKTLNLMRLRRNLLVGIAFIILGITIYLLSYTEARGIHDWSLSPAFFPRLAATFIVGLSLLLVVVDAVMRKRNSVPASERIQWRVFSYVIATIGIMILYVYLIEWLGFIPATTITMAGMMVLYGSRRWVLIALTSVCLPLLIYFFALKVMYVLFPAGKVFQ
jgi:putative tricarboxylic transport membrane protein